MGCPAFANGEFIDIPKEVPKVERCKFCDRILLPNEVGEFQGFCYQCWQDTDE